MQWIHTFISTVDNVGDAPKSTCFPTKASAVHNLGSDHNEAVEDYLTSIALDHSMLNNHIQLAASHYKSGDVKRSVEGLRQLIAQFPRESQPRFVLYVSFFSSPLSLTCCKVESSS